MWVKSEDIEVDHYISIRAEFERLKRELNGLSRTQGNHHILGHEDTLSEDPFSFQSICCFLHPSRRFRGRSPLSLSRYNKLLVMVRFHELKVVFLKMNNLPGKFKVSKYLKNSEMHVLMKMTHIAINAWLALMAVVNLMYFVLGAVIYGTKNVSSSVKMLSAVFIIFCVFGMLMGFALYEKMKSIFRTIMHINFINKDSRDTQFTSTSNDFNQMALFWFGNPKFVIYLIQFMLFGYATCLSTILLFWPTLKSPYNPIPFAALCTIFTFCYLMFLYLTAHIIPRYTLCTSLGQLVDINRLNESLAKFHLEEATRKRKYMLDAPAGSTHTKTKAITLTEKDSPHGTVTSKKEEQRESDRLSLLASLVLKDTKDLLEIPEYNELKARRGARMNRARCKSDGVAAMAAFRTSVFEKSNNEHNPKAKKSGKNGVTELTPGTRPTSPGQREKDRAERRRLRKTQSENVEAMRALGFQRAPIVAISASEAEKAARGKKFYAKDDQSVAPETSRAARALGVQRRGSFSKKKETSSSTPSSSSPTAKVERDRSNLRNSISTPDLTTLNSLSTLDETKPITEFDEEVAGAIDMINKPPPLPRNPSFRSKKSDDDTSAADDASDIDDIPDVDVAFATVAIGATKPKSTMKNIVLKGRAFFSSDAFLTADFVFGSMCCFFIVGMRLDEHLVAKHIIDPTYATPSFPLRTAFIAESVWLSVFMVESTIILVLYLMDPVSKKGFEMCVAAVSDFLLSGLCLILLMVSEVERCCKYPFGENYGFGMIEPWTSLIFLRIGRFVWARKVKQWYYKATKMRFNKNEHHGEITDRNASIVQVEEHMKSLNSCHTHTDSHHNHGHDLSHKKGTIAELWMEAVSKHPDVVQMYGDMSTEMLQVMLGLSIIEDTKKACQSQGVPNDVAKTSDGGFPAPSVVPAPSEDDNRIDPDLPTEIRVEMEEGESIFVNPEAPLIRSMRRCEKKLPPYLNDWTIVDVVMTKYEIVFFDGADHYDDNTTSSADMDAMACAAYRNRIHKALIATKGGKGLRLQEVASGRKVVGHVTISDITKITVEKIIHKKSKHEHHNHSQNVMTTLATTDGDIEMKSGYVEGSSARTQMNKLDCEAPSKLGHFHEYWHKSNPTSLSSCRDLTEHWHDVDTEDRLKIVSNHFDGDSALYLRFLADLKDAEIMSEVNDNQEELTVSKVVENVTKNDAVLWCQTIVRICGPEQLHAQKLPNFGDLGLDELRDYLEVREEISGSSGNDEDTGAMSDRSVKMMSRKRMSMGGVKSRKTSIAGAQSRKMSGIAMGQDFKMRAMRAVSSHSILQKN